MLKIDIIGVNSIALYQLPYEYYKWVPWYWLSIYYVYTNVFTITCHELIETDYANVFIDKQVMIEFNLD